MRVQEEPPADQLRGRHARSADPRAKGTRAAIIAATTKLLDSSEELPSVSAVVAAAGVSRSSFYTHFPAVEAAALAAFDEASARISDSEQTARHEHVDSIWHITAHATLEVVEYVEQNIAVFRPMLTRPAFATAAEAVHDQLAQRLRRSIASLPEMPAGLGIDRAAAYIASGSLRLISDWLADDDRSPAADLVELIMLSHPAWLTRPARPVRLVPIGRGDDEGNERRKER